MAALRQEAVHTSCSREPLCVQVSVFSSSQCCLLLSTSVRPEYLKVSECIVSNQWIIYCVHCQWKGIHFSYIPNAARSTLRGINNNHNHYWKILWWYRIVSSSGILYYWFCQSNMASVFKNVIKKICVWEQRLQWYMLECVNLIFRVKVKHLWNLLLVVGKVRGCPEKCSQLG